MDLVGRGSLARGELSAEPDLGGPSVALGPLRSWNLLEAPPHEGWVSLPSVHRLDCPLGWTGGMLLRTQVLCFMTHFTDEEMRWRGCVSGRSSKDRAGRLARQRLRACQPGQLGNAF